MVGISDRVKKKRLERRKDGGWHLYSARRTGPCIRLAYTAYPAHRVHQDDNTLSNARNCLRRGILEGRFINNFYEFSDFIPRSLVVCPSSTHLSTSLITKKQFCGFRWIKRGIRVSCLRAIPFQNYIYIGCCETRGPNNMRVILGHKRGRKLFDSSLENGNKLLFINIVRCY